MARKLLPLANLMGVWAFEILGMLGVLYWPNKSLPCSIMKINSGFIFFTKKYPNWSLWDRNCTSNASWFYNSICKVADILKPNLKISVFNPNITSFFNDPWLVDLPLSNKPIYFNMNMVDNYFFTQIISNNSFDLNACTELFGNNLDFDGISTISHEALENNNWLWWPTPTKGRLVATIYDHLNSFEELVNH